MLFELFDYVNLAATLNSQGRYHEAVEACRLGLEQRRDLPLLFAQLGRAALGLERAGDAIAACEAALGLDPLCLPAQLELALALRLSGDRAGALAQARAALAGDPGSEHAHCVLATLLLWDGATAEGLREQEWHWVRETELLERRFGVERRWDGVPAPGLRLLVAHEQGYGDLFHVARYLRALREQAGTLLLECAPDAAELMRTVPGVDRVIAKGEATPRDFDAYVRLMSVPAHFGADPAASAIPYLHAAATPAAGEGLRVGFAWSGNPQHANDRERSVEPERFAALGTVAGVTWVSLRKGPEFPSFSETAACIATLDLVISVDTSVAHLAGAMGKSVWLLLPARPDWRWGIEGERTAWYPSMRLFRRAFGRPWDDVFERVRAELEALAIR